MTMTVSEVTALRRLLTYSQELSSHLIICEECWSSSIASQAHRLARLKVPSLMRPCNGSKRVSVPKGWAGG